MRTLVAQAVAELHLGRTEEAQAALEQALRKEPEYVEAIANLLVLNVITGKSPEELKRYVPLGGHARKHCLTMGLARSKRLMLSIHSWWTSLRRVICSIRLRQSTRPRRRHRGVFL